MAVRLLWSGFIVIQRQRLTHVKLRGFDLPGGGAMAKDNGKISSLASEIMRLSHDHILMHLRFFDSARAVFLCT
jgi:hypothetical protein